MLEGLASKDKKIIMELDKDSRISASALSRKIRLPKETVNYRIKLLSEKGYIKNFYAVINSSLIGYRLFKVYIKTHKITGDVESLIIKYITSKKCCFNLRITEGYFDMDFITMQKDVIHMQNFMKDFMDSFGRYVTEKSFHILIRAHKINIESGYAGRIRKISFEIWKNVNNKVDMTDISILRSIAENSRARIVDIAAAAGEEPRVIIYRIKKMEKSGIIAGYSIALDFDRLRMELVQVDISLKTLSVIDDIIEFFGKEGSCIFAYEMMGDYDLCVEIAVRNDEILRNILGKFREMFLDYYISYEISHIYREWVINLVPFVVAAPD